MDKAVFLMNAQTVEMCPVFSALVLIMSRIILYNEYIMI